jgi:hypothetical protein
VSFEQRIRGHNVPNSAALPRTLYWMDMMHGAKARSRMVSEHEACAPARGSCPRVAKGVGGWVGVGVGVLSRTVGELCVVPAGALPVSVPDSVYRGLNRQMFSGQSRNHCRPKQFYCRPRPAAQLLPIRPGAC